MKTVRMNVAKSELMFSTPTFAKMAVSAAKIADNRAQMSQEAVAVSGMTTYLLVLPALGNETARVVTRSSSNSQADIN